VVKGEGVFEEREVMVGVTSRIAAEVISGLEAGEQVVAGIIQANGNNGANRQQFNGPPGIRVMGGFR
jgi:macrolide-specific efflux system membrane fusion protein